MRGLPPGWRVVDMAPDKIDKHLEYVKQVSQELAAVPRIIKEAPKPPANATKEELEKFYFDQQPESTKQAILRQKERKPEDDSDYLLRPINPGYLANPNAKSLEELTAERSLSVSDVMLHMKTKTGRNQIGQSAKGSVDNGKRERGIEAFTYSKPADPGKEDLKRLKSLTEMDAVMVSEVPALLAPKKSWLKRLIGSRLPKWLLVGKEKEIE